MQFEVDIGALLLDVCNVSLSLVFEVLKDLLDLFFEHQVTLNLHVQLQLLDLQLKILILQFILLQLIVFITTLFCLLVRNFLYFLSDQVVFEGL